MLRPSLPLCQEFNPYRTLFSAMICNMKTIAITIEEDMLNRIDRLTTLKGGGATNRSKIIREAVRTYLSLMERSVEEEREREIFKRHRTRLARQAAILVKEQAKP